MKLGIISNPESERNKGRAVRRAGDWRGEPDVVQADLEDVADTAEILRGFAAEGVALVVVDGGDGTLQAVMTALLNERIFDGLPPLALLPSGMTNVVAKDVGLPGRDRDAVAALLEDVRKDRIGPRIQERYAMRLTYDPARGPIYGMFFATGAVYRAIAVCREVFHPLGFKSSVAIALTLAGLVGRRIAYGLFMGGREDSVYRGDRMRLDWDGAEGEPETNLLLLASTLEALSMGSAPFWGPGEGGLRASWVRFPPAKFLGSVGPFLKGNPDGALPEDYQSREGHKLTLHMDQPFTLDGELFEPVPGSPVILEAAGPLRFVT